MRKKFLHFSGGGLLVLGGIGHTILKKADNSDGSLSNEQKDLIKQLAHLDWSREGDLWAGYLIGAQGSISAGKNNIALAVAKAKRYLDLPLSEGETKILRKSEEANVIPVGVAGD
jgi:hypothetical protein